MQLCDGIAVGAVVAVFSFFPSKITRDLQFALELLQPRAFLITAL